MTTGAKKKNAKNKTKQNPLFILRAIDPEWCQMFGECSETERTVRETGRQDQPDAKISQESLGAGGGVPLPEVPQGRNFSVLDSLLTALGSLRHSSLSPLPPHPAAERAGAQCRLPGQSSRA